MNIIKQLFLFFTLAIIISALVFLSFFSYKIFKKIEHIEQSTAQLNQADFLPSDPKSLETGDGLAPIIPDDADLLTQAEQVNIQPVESPEKMTKKIKLLPPLDGVYHAAFPEFIPFEDEVSDEKLDNFSKLIKKEIAWVYFSNNWFKGIVFPLEQIEIIKKRGLTPFVRLMPRSRFQTGGQDPVYTLEKIIKGDFDADIIQWAQSAKQTEIPILIEFGAEMNGNWFTWSGASNGAGSTDQYGDSDYPDGPERFRDAYRHIIDIFRLQGASNITWFFHVSLPSYPEAPWNQPHLYYPGEEYIDWLGISVYGAQYKNDKWKLFSEIMDKHYGSITEIDNKKPVALLEFGIIEIAGQDKGLWIEDALKSLIDKKYPNLYAMSYWHSIWTNSNGSISDMRINSSPQSLEKYNDLIQDPVFVGTAIFSEN